MRSYKLYIFDWDGTLMDSIARIVSSMQAAAQYSDFPMPTSEAVKDIIGLSLPVAVQTLFPSADEKTQQLIVDEYKRQYEKVNDTPSCLFSNVTNLLNQLKHQGKFLAIATGKGRNGLNKVLTSTQTVNYFDVTRCADETQSKPHPDMLYQIIDALSISPQDSVMIGDTGFDLAMANKANIDSIGVTMGVASEIELATHKPKKIVHSIDELMSVCCYN